MNAQPTSCQKCGLSHSPGALRVATVLLDGKAGVPTEYGRKSACGVADLIDRETHASDLLAALKAVMECNHSLGAVSRPVAIEARAAIARVERSAA